MDYSHFTEHMDYQMENERRDEDTSRAEISGVSASRCPYAPSFQGPNPHLSFNGRFIGQSNMPLSMQGDPSTASANSQYPPMFSPHWQANAPNMGHRPVLMVPGTLNSRQPSRVPEMTGFDPSIPQSRTGNLNDAWLPLPNDSNRQMTGRFSPYHNPPSSSSPSSHFMPWTHAAALDRPGFPENSTMASQQLPPLRPGSFLRRPPMPSDIAGHTTVPPLSASALNSFLDSTRSESTSRETSQEHALSGGQSNPQTPHQQQSNQTDQSPNNIDETSPRRRRPNDARRDLVTARRRIEHQRLSQITVERYGNFEFDSEEEDSLDEDDGFPQYDEEYEPTTYFSTSRNAISRAGTSRNRERDIEVLESIAAEEMLHERMHAAQRAARLARKPIPSAATIASFERLNLKTLEGDDRNCVICYNEFGIKNPDGVIETPLRLPKCKHVFGDHCIKRWFQDSDSCPYCREKVPSELPRYRHNIDIAHGVSIDADARSERNQWESILRDEDRLRRDVERSIARRRRINAAQDGEFPPSLHQSPTGHTDSTTRDVPEHRRRQRSRLLAPPRSPISLSGRSLQGIRPVLRSTDYAAFQRQHIHAFNPGSEFFNHRRSFLPVNPAPPASGSIGGFNAMLNPTPFMGSFGGDLHRQNPPVTGSPPAPMPGPPLPTSLEQMRGTNISLDQGSWVPTRFPSSEEVSAGRPLDQQTARGDNGQPTWQTAHRNISAPSM